MSVFETDAYEAFITSREGQSFSVARQVEEWFARHFNLEIERVKAHVIERVGEQDFELRVIVLDHAGQDTFNLDQNELLTVRCVLRGNGAVVSFNLHVGKRETLLRVREFGPFAPLDLKQHGWIANVLRLGEILATRDEDRKREYFA